MSSSSGTAHDDVLLGADAAYTGSTAWYVSALIAVSAAVLGVNDELVRDVASLELDDVPPAECTAEGLTVVDALENVCLASFSDDATDLIDLSPTYVRTLRCTHRQCMKRLASKAATLLLHHCPVAANQVPLSASSCGTAQV